jgi:predicted dehydrogenase
MSGKEDKVLEVALLGTGMIGRIQMRAFTAHPRCRVRAVCDVNSDAAKRVADEFRVPEVFRDYEDLLAKCEVDAVTVCTPPFLHERMTVAALEAGKHVLCEKPLTVSPESAARMVKAAQRRKRLFACCSARFRTTPVFKAVKDLVQSGELGQIYFIKMTGIGRGQRPGIVYNAGAHWFLDKSKAGGGALSDWGVYDLDVLYGLLGGLPVRSVSGFAFQGVGDIPLKNVRWDVEDHGAAILRCDRGLSVAWERGWVTHMKEEIRFQVYGSKGGVAFNPYQIADPPTIEIYRDAQGLRATETVYVTKFPFDIHKDFIWNFIDCVLDGGAPLTPGAAAADMIRIIHAVYESEKTGAEVKL